MTTTTTIVPLGPYELRESATFGFGHRVEPSFDGVLRVAFCVDGHTDAAGVEIRQDGAGVHLTIHGRADPATVTAQVARMLSLDHDATHFAAVGERDPVIGRLQAAAPGLRPPQFHSPYEAAAWSVLSARRPVRQMAQLRDRLCAAHGTTFELAGQQVQSFPTPRALLQVEDFPGLPALKLARLHAVARAALDGRLDVERLAGLGPTGAAADLRELPGIGPFYASLVVVRACGLADVLVDNEAAALEAMTRLYDLPGPPSPAEIVELAEPWRPFRTWAAVLLRAAAHRLEPAAAG